MVPLVQEEPSYSVTGLNMDYPRGPGSSLDTPEGSVEANQIPCVLPVFQDLWRGNAESQGHLSAALNGWQLLESL